MGFGSFCQAPTRGDFLNMYTPEEWEHSVADSQSFARKLNREGIRLYGWQPALSGLLWKAAHDLRGAEILNGVWRRERFSHAADNGENAKMQGSTL